MKKLAFLNLLIIVIVFSSCVTMMDYDHPTKNKIMQLRAGMPRTEVLELFGKPNYRSLIGGNTEVWEYRISLLRGGYDIIKLQLENDKVVNFESFFLQELTVPTPYTN